jgi:cell division topological specificity factor
VLRILKKLFGTNSDQSASQARDEEGSSPQKGKKSARNTQARASERAQSKSLARSRLHFVLVQDRTGLGNDEMARFKSELVAVIEKYFLIDKQGFDIDYKREADTTTLLINSPVIVRRQDSPGGQVGAKRGLVANAAAAIATTEAKLAPSEVKGV